MTNQITASEVASAIQLAFNSIFCNYSLLYASPFNDATYKASIKSRFKHAIDESVSAQSPEMFTEMTGLQINDLFIPENLKPVFSFATVANDPSFATIAHVAKGNLAETDETKLSSNAKMFRKLLADRLEIARTNFAWLMSEVENDEALLTSVDALFNLNFEQGAEAEFVPEVSTATVVEFDTIAPEPQPIFAPEEVEVTEIIETEAVPQTEKVEPIEIVEVIDEPTVEPTIEETISQLDAEMVEEMGASTTEKVDAEWDSVIEFIDEIEETESVEIVSEDLVQNEVTGPDDTKEPVETTETPDTTENVETVEVVAEIETVEVIDEPVTETVEVIDIPVTEAKIVEMYPQAVVETVQGEVEFVDEPTVIVYEETSVVEAPIAAPVTEQLVSAKLGLILAPKQDRQQAKPQSERLTTFSDRRKSKTAKQEIAGHSDELPKRFIGKMLISFPVGGLTISSKSEANRLASLKADAKHNAKAASILERFVDNSGKLANGMFNVMADGHTYQTKRHFANFPEGFVYPTTIVNAILGNGRFLSVEAPMAISLKAARNNSYPIHSELTSDTTQAFEPVLVNPLNFTELQKWSMKCITDGICLVGNYTDKSRNNWLVFIDPSKGREINF